MRIGGLQKCSLIDFPGRVCAVVFTQGCNFRCPYCHNPQLVYPERFETPLDEDDVFAFLKKRRHMLDGVTVTGGEPCLQPDLPAFLRKVKAMGFEVKLDTNGSRPDMLRRVLDGGVVDYVAMDVKAPPDKYAAASGVPGGYGSVMESVGLLAASGTAHHFRTTVDPVLLDDGDVERIRSLVPPGSGFVRQECRVLSDECSGERA